jgi:dUTP pyrophosphatase
MTTGREDSDIAMPGKPINVTRVGEHTLPIPRRETAEAAGFDLRASVAWILYPGEQRAIPTGFAWEIPRGYAGVIKDRSGIAARSHVRTAAGVIDADYRGEVRVLLRNAGDDAFWIDAGDRIAQLLVIPCVLGSCEEVSELADTARGAGGFGSTGAA